MSSPTSGQWRRIKELFQAARDLPAEDRLKFLAEQCTADPYTRSEVERLLAAAEQPSGLLDSPPFQASASSRPGDPIPPKISRYRILEKLGEGGMGVVYCAEDETLKRQVAIKVLLPDEMADPERKRRFVREAQAASALNHPNIITVYDVGTDEGIDYIAMEYVSGETLRKRIRRKGLDLATALRYAIQIADAVAAAHAAGIIHRDLKPGNIMVTEENRIKVLDFGLAKPARTGRLEGSETQTVTLKGLIVGTAAYMSPEQAEGKNVDERTDIFSFGSVLYEMLTGQCAFQGQSDMSVLSSILTKEPPPISEIVAGSPREIDRIVAMCLRKEAARRFRHMDDIKLALEELKEEVDSGAIFAPRRTAPAFWLQRSRLALILLLAAALGSTPWWWPRILPAPAVHEPLLARLTSDAGLSAYPALSPDGRLLAYASDRSGDGNLDIWVQQIGGENPIRLTQHEADDYDPVFSSDGTKIAFRSEREGGGIYMVSALGGEARLTAAKGNSPRFSPDGKRLAYWIGEHGMGFLPGSAGIFILDLAGAQPQPFHPEFPVAQNPVWSFDGKQLLFLARSGRDPRRPAGQSADDEPLRVDWWMAPFSGGPAVRTGALFALRAQKLAPLPGLARPVPIAWLREGDQVLFAATSGDSTNVWQVPVSRKTGKVAGKATRRTVGTGLEMQASAPDEAQGRLVYSSITVNVDPWSLPMDPNRQKAIGKPQRLTQDLSFDGAPSLSSDGKKMIFSSSRSGRWGIWLRNLETGKETLLAAFPGYVEAKISGDGDRVAYRSPGERKGFFMKSSGGAPEQFCDRCGPPTHLSFNGRYVLHEEIDTLDHVALVDTVAHSEIDLTPATAHPEYSMYAARFSPDERWISFHARTGKSSARQIFIVPFQPGRTPEQREWIAVTGGSTMDRESYWSPDGKLLYFLSDRDGFRCIWAIALDPASKHPVGEPFEVYAFHRARYSLSTVGPTVGAVGLSVARDKIVFAMSELTGNIWMSTPDRQ